MELILFLEKHHIYTIKGKSFTELLPCDIVTKLKPHIDNVYQESNKSIFIRLLLNKKFHYIKIFFCAILEWGNFYFNLTDNQKFKIIRQIKINEAPFSFSSYGFFENNMINLEVHNYTHIKSKLDIYE